MIKWYVSICSIKECSCAEESSSGSCCWSTGLCGIYSFYYGHYRPGSTVTTGSHTAFAILPVHLQNNLLGCLSLRVNLEIRPSGVLMLLHPWIPLHLCSLHLRLRSIAWKCILFIMLLKCKCAFHEGATGPIKRTAASVSVSCITCCNHVLSDRKSNLTYLSDRGRQ